MNAETDAGTVPPGLPGPANPRGAQLLARPHTTGHLLAELRAATRIPAPGCPGPQAPCPDCGAPDGVSCDATCPNWHEPPDGTGGDGLLFGDVPEDEDWYFDRADYDDGDPGEW